MENSLELKQFEIIYVIVNPGLGSKVIKIAKQHEITGGTVFFGKGTVKNRFLELLDLNDVRKEIVLLISERIMVENTLKIMDKEFKFNQPHHGIAFSIPVKSFKGRKSCSDSKENRGGNDKMYDAIFTIVDKGKGDVVIEAATKAGSRGGTIINARGSGIHETSTLFSMAIEPEKEIVLILTECAVTESIVSSIRERLEIDKPGNGIVFVQDVNQTYGLY